MVVVNVTLSGWMCGSRKVILLIILCNWRELRDHLHGCYFYMVDISPYKISQDRKKLDYPDISSYELFSKSVDCQVNKNDNWFAFEYRL